MASLKETKQRISSVRSTLKITSAMKMVSSAKLHKAQAAIEAMLPYERKLSGMLSLLLSSSEALAEGGADSRESKLPLDCAAAGEKVAIVAVGSNSSLCGAFNANVIRETKARVAQLESEGCRVEVFSVGKKIAEAMKKAGYPSEQELSDLVAHSSYEASAAFAQSLQDAFASGKYSRIELIYNHFVSTATQKVTLDTYLPAQFCATAQEPAPGAEDIILEPSPEEMLSSLLPKVLSLRVYTVILDSVASEHAARTVAMQTATDNGEDILQELTLEYNKGRQQKITSEILDIVGGSMQ